MQACAKQAQVKSGLQKSLELICGATCLVLFLAIASGQIWLSMSRTGFMDDHGHIVARDTWRQCLLETYIVFFIYLVMSCSLACALELRALPRNLITKRDCQKCSVILLIVFALAYAQLQHLARLKLAGNARY